MPPLPEDSDSRGRAGGRIAGKRRRNGPFPVDDPGTPGGYFRSLQGAIPPASSGSWGEISIK